MEGSRVVCAEIAASLRGMSVADGRRHARCVHPFRRLFACVVVLEPKRSDQRSRIATCGD
jgi:hypothetical protein